MSSELRKAGIQSSALVPSDWSLSGRHLLLTSTGPGTGFDIWRYSFPEKKLEPLVRANADQMHGNFSPDDKWIAYSSSESGRFEVYAQTLSTPPRKWQVSTEGGSEPRWRADGRELYYLSPDSKLMAVSVGAGPSFGVPRALFQSKVINPNNVYRTHYVPSKDGQRFLINDSVGGSLANSITVVLNWTRELRK